MSAPVSVLIPTYNEEIHLAACLASVAGWANEIFVVDSLQTAQGRSLRALGRNLCSIGSKDMRSRRIGRLTA